MDRQHAHRVVVLDRRVGVQPAEGQDVPVVVADALAGVNGLRAIRAPLQPAAPVVPHPIGIDDLALQRVMLGHDVAQGGAHPVDIGAQEAQVARPPEVFGAAAHEVLAVDVVARVVLREERLDDHAARGGVAQPDAQLRHLARPLRVTIHRDHRVADGVALHRLEIHPPGRAEVGQRRRGPFDKRLRRAQAGGLPAKLEEGHFEGVALPRRRRHEGGGVGDLDAPPVLVDAGVARSGQLPSLGLAQIVRPPARPRGVLEGEMPAAAAPALVPERETASRAGGRCSRAGAWPRIPRDPGCAR